MYFKLIIICPFITVHITAIICQKCSQKYWIYIYINITYINMIDMPNKSTK